MTKKLVSLNFSMKLVVKDGKQERDIRFTGVLPSKSFSNVEDLLNAVCESVNDEFETNYYPRQGYQYPEKEVIILKPKRLPRPVVNVEKNIKELVG